MGRSWKTVVLLVGLMTAGCGSETDQGGSGAVSCDTRECFTERVAACDAATYETAGGAGAQARYTILGSGDGGCRIQLEYISNPNPQWVDKPLTFVVDPDKSFEPQLEAAVAGCLGGGASDAQCGGPLFELVGKAGAGDKAATEPPCGETPDTEGEVLYALPRDGKWGYVNRRGEWVIEPRWRQAEPFSEGRAAVDANGRWGVIDRQGRYVVEPRLGAQAFSTINGERYGHSPIKPYSQGCAAVVGATASDPPYFLDRQGRTWLKENRPEGLADKDLREFGPFSEGKAWFRAYASESGNVYGWIDTQGTVVIEADYANAGVFRGGLAPAAIKRGYWGFIDGTGELVVPGKWTLGYATAFSQQLAAVEIDTFQWAYLHPEKGFVIEAVKFDPPLERTVGGGADAKDKTFASADIEQAGRFHDGLAPAVADLPPPRELLFIDTDGKLAFVPDHKHGIKVCRNLNPLPEYREGLVRLLVANDGVSCGDRPPGSGLAEYDKAHYVFLDTSGNVVLEQPFREGDTDALPDGR